LKTITRNSNAESPFASVYAEMLLRACDILEEAKVSATDPSA
jgi:hypothetical protein